MKSKSTRRHLLLIAASSLMAVSSAHAQTTYIWANSNVIDGTTTLDWFSGGSNTQGTWNTTPGAQGTSLLTNADTVRFFTDSITSLPNTTTAILNSIVNNGGAAVQFGTLTLSGRSQNIANAVTTINISGDALNFSAATGTIIADATNANPSRTVIYNVANDIQLGTASTGSVLTIAGAGGSAFNLNGIISELQTGGGSLVKTGASTVSLTVANTFTGSTTINGGNVTLSGASGSLASTSIALNGGGLTLNNSSTTGNSANRISNSATITANGSSALTFSHNSASGIDYSETIGTLSLQSGSFTYTGSQANNSGPRSSNVLFSTLSRSGTATANFAGTGLGTNGQNTIKFGSGVTADADLGPWAVVNGTVFAYYGATNGVTAGTSSTLAASSNSATTNFNTNGGDITFDPSLNPSLKTLLINSTTARTVSLNDNTVSVGGISAASNTNNIFHTINGTGALQALNAGDALYVNFSSTNSGSRLQIDSNIQNYNGGTTGSALVKYGAGTVNVGGAVNISGGLVVNAGTLNLTNVANSITGGFTLNGGTLVGISTATHNNNNITVNASSFLGMANGATTDGTITLNADSILSLGTNNNAATFNGAVTGAGSIAIDRLGLGGNTINLNSTGNTFTGNILFTGAGARTLNINSLTDTTTLGAGNIRFLAPTATFALGSGAVAPLTLNNRQFEFVAGTITIGNNSSQTFTVNSDLLIGISGVSASLGLAGTGSGLSSFNGKIENGSLTSLGLTKSGSGTWVLGNNANTYTGLTIINGGTLRATSIADYGSASALGSATSGAIQIVNATFEYTGDGDESDRQFQLHNTNQAANSATILNNGTGALIFDAPQFNSPDPTTGGSNGSRPLTLGGSYTDGINEIRGNIVANAFAGRDTSIVKTGAGSWKLSGTNTYIAATSVQQGNLIAGSDAPNNAAGAFGISTGDINLGVANGSDNAGLLIGGAFTVGRNVRLLTNNTTDTGTRVLTIGGNSAHNSEFSGSIILGTNSNAGRGVTLTAASGGQVTFSGVIQNPTSMDATTYTVTKAGLGTVVLGNTNTYTGATAITEGTLKLGANEVLPDGSALTLGAATLDADTRTDTVGTLNVTGSAVINLGTGAKLTFANSSAGGTATWAGSLNLVGFVSGASLNFSSLNGLTTQQLSKISAAGFSNFSLDAEGDLIADNSGGPGPLDHFAISAIGSPQTAGTPITGITLTAQDASNQTVTSFNGTVTFSGGGGFSGTSASFTSGVLTGVTVTPTISGSNLTLIVTDPVSGKFGTQTIATIQSQYEAWSGGAPFAGDANGDGIENGLAFLLGATGPNINALNKLPVPEEISGGLKLTFQMLPASARGTAALSLEHSNTLATGSWTTLAVPSANDTVGDVVFTITGTNPLNVTATIPASKANGGKLFGRVKAVGE